MLRRQVLQSLALGAGALACQRANSVPCAPAAAASAPASRSPRRGALTAPATHHDVRGVYEAIGPLGDDVFTQRRGRARELAHEAGATLVFAACGSTSFAYLVGADFQRSERLIAFVLPTDGEPFLVAPSFEVERVQKRARAVRIVGWDESDDPCRVIRRELGESRARGGMIIDPATEYATVMALAHALPALSPTLGLPGTRGALLFDALRVAKTSEELTRMRRAIEITEDAIASTFDQLEVGMRDADIARVIKDEHKKRDVDGGALVQLGPDAALPHGAPSGRVLAAGMVILIDGGCTFQGYWSDISRTRWFFGDQGHEPPPRFREIYRIVHDAQSAAMARVRPGVPAQEIDRAARAVIAKAGYGAEFTHRLGHGIGMDGHEAVYMVEGNTRVLEPGFVFSVEPGIYLPK